MELTITQPDDWHLHVLLGDVGPGKSSLLLHYVKGQFAEFQESTTGAAFFAQTVAVNEATLKFEIWDSAGHERFNSLAPMYHRGAAAAAAIIKHEYADSNSSDLLQSLMNIYIYKYIKKCYLPCF